MCSICDPNGYYFSEDQGTCVECEKDQEQQFADMFKSQRAILIMSLLFVVFLWGLIVSIGLLHIMLGSPPLPKHLLWMTPFFMYFSKLRALYQTVRKRLKLKIKALLSFSQVVANITFNCAVSFPSNFDGTLKSRLSGV
jgi:hypothetical protein